MTWLYWSLLSALFSGATAVLAKIGVKGVDSNLATAIRTSFILVLTWLIALTLRKPEPWRFFTGETWLFLGFSAVATALAWLCYFRALQLGMASRVASIDKLSVVFAILFAVLFLGENLKWHHWLGAALITSGAILLAVD